MKNEEAPVRRHALPGPKESGCIMTNTPHPRGSQARLERRGPAVEGFSTLTDSNVGLIIEHATTVDLADGQPLPPLIFDGVVWRVVCRLAGARTRWGRIALAENPARPDGRPLARDFNPAAERKA
jgi:hypothetical protein